MPSSILNWATPYHHLFPNNSLLTIDPKVFGCTCFIRDVCPQVSKLDPKSLKCIFMGYSCVQKQYRCYCPTLRRYFVYTDIAFFETTPFSMSSTVTSQEEDDDLLVYTVSSPVPTSAPAPIFTAPALIHVKPLITQVYSWRQNPSISSLTSAASSSDPIQNDDLLIALCKGISVLTQSLRLFPITICRHLLVPLLLPWILSLSLTLSMRLYLTLVGVMLWWKKCRLQMIMLRGTWCLYLLKIKLLVVVQCKTRENSNFLKKGKMVISVKIQNFSRSRMTKRTSPLESSREI